jgi:hypothetical protein
MFDTNTKMSVASEEYLVHPVRKGHDTLNLASVGFLDRECEGRSTSRLRSGLHEEAVALPTATGEPQGEDSDRFEGSRRMASEVLREADVNLDTIGENVCPFRLHLVLWTHRPQMP